MTFAIAISGSPSHESRSRRLVSYAARRLEDSGAATKLIDRCEFAADDLIGRTRSGRIVEAIHALAGAHIVVVGTPVYRAAYSGLLKVFFDLLPQDALMRKVAIPIATGGALVISS